MNVKGHKLFGNDGKPVEFVDTPNKGGGEFSPRYLLMHYTAGLSLKGSVSWLKNPEAKASAHIVVARDGKVVQMVAFDRRAWHAGQSRWGELTGMNAYSIGIELDNAGKLQRRADGAYMFVSGSGQKVIAPDEVVVARHKDEPIDAGWHIYSAQQLEVASEIGRALHAQYGFLDVLGHDDVSPGRKVDPGPAFPMTSFRSKVLGRE